MKRQKQIDESKEMITSAFKKLLRENDYNDITLSEIAVHAGVTRMTLYRHFKTKEKIILYRAQKILEELEDQIEDKARPYRDLLRRGLEWIRNLPQLPILIQSREIEELLDNFREATYSTALEQRVGKRVEDDPYLFHFYFGGVNRIIREWLRNGCCESSQEMADRIISLTSSFVLSNRGLLSDQAGG